jgi:hypothetical protein
LWNKKKENNTTKKFKVWFVKYMGGNAALIRYQVRSVDTEKEVDVSDLEKRINN